MFAVIYIKWNANDGINVYYLLTGHVPSKTEAHELSQELKQRSLLTETQYICYVHYPKTCPMTKLSSGILYLQRYPIFASQYSKGCPKHTYWEHTYEDALNILAKLPEMCAHIYKNTYDKPNIETPNAHLDYSAILEI